MYDFDTLTLYQGVTSSVNCENVTWSGRNSALATVQYCMKLWRRVQHRVHLDTGDRVHCMTKPVPVVLPDHPHCDICGKSTLVPCHCCGDCARRANTPPGERENG